jgi:hypothetical protein
MQGKNLRMAPTRNLGLDDRDLLWRNDPVIFRMIGQKSWSQGRPAVGIVAILKPVPG